MAAKKTKRLRVLQVGKKQGRGQREFSFESREPLADPAHRGAAESIDAAAVARRFAAHEIAMEVVGAGYKEVLKDGLYRLHLNRPLTKADLYEVLIKSAMLFGTSRKEAIELVNRGSTRPSKALVFRNYTMLGSTSKMGCYSFNLPAGPIDLLGNCPAASPGFMYSTEDQRQRAQRALVAQLPIHVGNFICNGCYAIKGSYGNPNQTVHQQIKRILVEQWLDTPAPSGRYSSLFVETLIRHIGKTQELSVKRRKKVKRDRWWQINHPNYFRIHDAGDFYHPRYTEAWFEIIRSMPNVLFWAPTRMWAMRGLAYTVFQKGIPENLALRPSALHFGEMPPPVDNPSTPKASIYGMRVPGLSAPSGAARTIPPGVWECPAMMHATEGGGAVPKLIKEGPRKGQPLIDKAGNVALMGGMCARAHGPNSPLRGGTDIEDTPDRGGGCRVCWRNRDLQVFYHEH